MGTLWQDIRYGLRILARSPGFTAAVVAMLAVGIGANTAIFSVVNAVMLRPLPYKHAHRFVFLFERTEWGNQPPAPTRFLLCREQNQVFDRMAGCSGERPYVKGIDNARQVRAEAVSPDFFPLLSVQPMLGRDFRPEEEQPGHERVVILSHSFWQTDWGGTPEVIGKTMNVDDNIYTIIGVLPPDFEPPIGSSATALWRPLVVAEIEPSAAVFTLARLKKGITLKQARAAMAMTAERVKEADAEAGENYALVLQRPLDRYLEGKRKPLLLLLGAAGFVLLIACSNVASLFLARAAVRKREMVMRAALGASKGRVLRQMLTESLLLSAGGGAMGLLLTFWSIQGLVHLCPANIPRLTETSVDISVLAFTLGVSILTGLLFGVAPAWRASGVRMTQMLQEGMTRSSTGRKGRRLHGSLVIAQMGLSLILLIGAALLIRSLVALHGLDLGFQPQSVLAVNISLPATKYPEPRRCQAFYESLLEGVQALPDVRLAGLSLGELGLGTGGFGPVGIRIPTRSYANPEQRDPTMLSCVSLSFLETLGVPLLRGRTFTKADISGSTGSVIIDEHLARKEFGDTDPIGQRIDFVDSQHIIVGVVGTVRDFRNLEQPAGTIYAPIPRDLWSTDMALIVKTGGDPMRLAGAIRSRAAELEKDEVIRRVETVETMLSGMLTQRRFVMILLTLFAGIALILATVGVYGLLHYSTTRQTREIAIRMALGARKLDVLRAILAHGFKLTLLGVGIGLAGAVALTRVLAGLLYGVTPTDPLTLAGVSLVLAAIALLACYLPARRAARIDPMVALRYE